MKLYEITNYLEEIYPLSLQESWDNSGLIVGNPGKTVNKALVTLDITEEVIDEAAKNNCDLIISHHPLIFKGIKRLIGNDSVQRMVESAIKNDIAVYGLHTNLDNSISGINAFLCEKLGLKSLKILSPRKEMLRKLVTFCPQESADKIRQALFDAGAGHIGNYDSCSFNTTGTGTFRGSDTTHPYVGEPGKLHYENETRIETIFPVYRETAVINILMKAHPYEEVAYDIYPLANEFHQAGSGMIGNLENAMNESDFLDLIKSTFRSKVVRHSALTGKEVKKVAVCSGSGAFLIGEAKKQGAGFFVTGDVKYHDFFEADGKLVIADVGHFESEVFTKELIHDRLIEKFSTFAVLISESNTNSVNYL